MPVTAKDPCFDPYRYRTKLDLTPHLPKLHQTLDLLLATYADPKRGLLYHVPLDEVELFPTPEEVVAEIPNSQGWFTALEDCSFMGPQVLWALTRHDCGLTRDRRREVGALLFHGASCLWSIPGTGFVARGIAPDRSDYYPNTSPDQIPNYLRGMWAWAKSDLSTPAERSLVADLFRSVLGRLESFKWELRRSDDKVGISSGTGVVNILPRGTPQFLSMFAMAGDVTGEGRYFDLFRKFRDEHSKARLNVIAHDEVPTWLPWQLELFIDALQVLDQLDTDTIARGAYRVGIRRAGALASTFVAGYGLWLTASRERAYAPIMPSKPARTSRCDFREGYRKSVEMGIDLTARWGQSMQGRIIAHLDAQNEDPATHDGRTALIDHLWGLSVIAQSGMPWSPDGARVQADSVENWIDVAQDVLSKCAPEVPWCEGSIALINFFSAWLRRNEDPR